MKLKEKKELFSKTIAELKSDLLEEQQKLMQHKLEHAQRKLANSRALFIARKQIAVLKTILKEKEFAASLPAPK